MQIIGDACLVRADATNLDCVWSVGRTTVGEGWTDERDDVVSSGKDEVPDETLIAVDDKISAKFFWFFMVFDEFGRGHGAKVTPYRLWILLGIAGGRGENIYLPEP
jgi:hypothetical protein